MQAHANDLRVEVEKDSAGLVEAGTAGPIPPAGCDAFVHQAVSDWRGCPVSDKVRVILEYAEKITRVPASCCQNDVHRLRTAGWSDAAIHDAVQVIAYFNYINRVADALGVELESGLPMWGHPRANAIDSGI
ncbi:MAG: hypothetical protein HBSAPP02_27240 [Phycisphaerae bacterium]|nr:MAG: hypothetical protein HRU71_01465 [Planctomycetia bacterium]GJQ27692.1 MAG: hypothetical protein HBSAPP02_27240 [Phycisphaerae bacterium]